MDPSDRNTTPAPSANAGGSNLVTRACGALPYAALIAAPWVAAPAAMAGPPLPVACPAAAGACGTSASQQFVQYGSATAAAVNATTLDVTQTTTKAVLNWASFNIANGYTVNFVQPSATAAVLNNIWDANPSSIAGALSANGQVYLYNQNGIVFANGAQINVAGLTASTLAFAPVAGATDPDALFENGILTAALNTNGEPGAVFVAPPSGTAGAIDVQSGATLTAADGGRIMLLGSAVTNQGTISTPDGQTILGAATNAVYLAASSSPDMRGLLIEVDGGGTTGTVINDGQITAADGNITLAGLIVNQQGVLTATTSVSANGSIYLMAGDISNTDNSSTGQYYSPTLAATTGFGGMLPTNGGTLLLAPGSVTQVLPDTTSTGTVTEADESDFITSQVDLAGRTVALEGNAAIVAPGGDVNTYASANPYNYDTDLGTPIVDGGTIYLDDSSTIDVAGLTNVSVPATQAVVQVTLETDDLQNDPQLVNGFLHGTTVTVDVNDPPSLFNVAPYAGNIELGVDQLLSAGGTINLDATSSVIARSGSTLNVSGGSIAYQGGYGPSTTELIASNGEVYNISDAPADLDYVGLANSYSYTDQTWGTSTKTSAETYYPSYTEGSSAGTIEVESQQVYLRGSLLGQTVDGPYQRTPSTMALGGTLMVGCSSCTNGGDADYGVTGGVTFTDALTDDLTDEVLYDGYVVSSTNLPAVSLLSPAELASGGFNHIDVYSAGAVTLPAGTNLTLAANGGLTIGSSQEIDIDGDIDAPGADVALQTVTAESSTPVPLNINLGAGVVIDVAGAWTNDSPLITSQPGTAPIVLEGGDVAIKADGDVTLGAGSLIDVSAGGWVNDENQLSTGSAGAITLAASYYPTQTAQGNDPYTGTLSLGAGAELLGASFTPGDGGTLKLQAASVTVGTAAQGTPGELLVSPNLFTQGGFSQYDIVGQDDIVIGNPADTGNSTPVTIAPVQQTLTFTKDSLLQPTGSNIAGFTQLQTLPVQERKPANVSFTTDASNTGATSLGDITLANDATIVTDPQGQVTLAAEGYEGSVDVFGTIDAPAGDITLQVATSTLGQGGDAGYLAGQGIELGQGAVLEAPADADIDTFNALGYTEGSVLSGGTVQLLAYKGFVQTDPGSLIDVDGTSAVLDIVGPQGVTPTTVAGNAGSITIGAREGIVLQGGLSAQAATLHGSPVAGAAGGTLNLDLGLDYDYGITSGLDASSQLYPTNTHILTLVGLDADDSLAIAPSSELQSGTADIDASSLQAGGFSNISISSADEIAFAGAVSLQSNASLTLDAPLFVANAGAQASLSSAYVAVGNYANLEDYYGANGSVDPTAAAVLNPVSGTGTLTVDAQQIDIRGISGWSGFATETFDSTGDIRFVAPENVIEVPPSVNVGGDPGFEGALNTSADLTLNGTQVYPTTATAFAINDLPSGGSQSPTVVTIASLTPGTTPQTPLSAGGSISIYATDINQDGVLRAPMGQIALNGVDIDDSEGNVVTAGSVTLAGGSLTSVSADGLTIPYGETVNGTEWIYSPAAGYDEVITAPPAKQITLDGSSVDIAGGATVDLSGGGDLYAYEFIAGEGGTVDVLNEASQTSSSRAANTPVYTYAIVPSLGSQFAPVDPQYQQSSSVGPNQTIYVSGVPGLPAGTYALLPAAYALLPGAYAVEVVAQNSGIALGSAVEQTSGGYITGALMGVAGTNILSSLTSTVLIASSATVRTESYYTNTYANSYFSEAATSAGAAAPALPADAGQLTLSAADSMSLGGTLDFATGSYSTTSSSGATVTEQGLGGDVAITAPDIEVVDSLSSQPQTGVLQLGVQQLDSLGAQTLILGATESDTPDGEQLSLGGTQTVELGNTATALTAPQVILAAQDQVTVDPGAQLGASSSSGTAALSSSTLLLPGGGALLRVSSGPAVALSVDPSTLPANPTGTVSIGAGADVSASGSLLLYGSDTTTLAAGAQIAAPAVSLYSSVVSLGDAPAGTPGLILTPQLLDSFQDLQSLTIGSNSTINFYGAVQLGSSGSNTPSLQSITLDAEGLGGYGSGNTVLQAGAVTLTNSNGAPPSFATTPDGTGTLQLVATGANGSSGQIELAGGETVSGYSAVQLSAAGDIVGSGTGSSLTIASSTPVPLTLSGAALIGTAGSSLSVATAGPVTLTGPSSSEDVTLPAPGLGAELSIQGSSISQDGVIDLPAGTVTLSATSGDVSLGSGSTTSAAGAVQDYTVTDAVAAAGQINLTSQTGNVVIGAGATVDVAGATASTGAAGNAGSLSVSAPLGTFTYAGSTLEGGAANGESQGNFTLDEGSGLGSNAAGNGFTALMTALSAGGFTGDINLRTQQDPAVIITGAVQAASFGLTVDDGSIEVGSTGVIDTSGGTPLDTDGGPISLWAGTGLTLDPGAQLLANGGAAGPVGANDTALAPTGGDITLGITSGTINLQPGSIIQMSGSDGGNSGTLLLRAPVINDSDNSCGAYVSCGANELAGNDVAITQIGSTITGGNPVVIEAYNAYQLQAGGALSTTGGDVLVNSADAPSSSDPDAPYSTLSTGTSGVMYGNAAALLADAASIADRLTGCDAAGGCSATGGLSVEIRPGVEVDSSGDIEVGAIGGTSQVWDLDSWTSTLGVPVDVTLRAAGNLVFNASLSDGFTDNGDALADWTFGESVGTESGNYMLTAGADLSSADPLAVIAQPAPDSSLGAPPNSGDVILAADNLIRTGTGNIAIAAGGDVLIGYSVGGSDDSLYDDGVLQVAEVDPLSSAIYTAGEPSAAVAAAVSAGLFTPTKLRGVISPAQTAAYPTDGGDVTVSAGDDIRSAVSSQMITDWLWRRSPSGQAPAPNTDTSWWIVFSQFDQGIGALGGGNLSLSAGRDIVNTSAVIPTTGALLYPADGTPQLSDLLLTGGGSLTVQAGGNIVSGVFEDDWGNASISAGGSLTSSADSTFGQATAGYDLAEFSGTPPPSSGEIYPVLVVGNGVFDVSAGGSISLQAVTNSTTLPMSNLNTDLPSLGTATAFYTYAPTGDPGTLNLVSAGGDVALDQGDELPIEFLSSNFLGTGDLGYSNEPSAAYETVYPPTLNVAALSGDIDLGDAYNPGAIAVFPAAGGNLTLLAAGSINNGDPAAAYSIAESQADPTLVPSPLAPTINFDGLADLSLPQEPLYQDSTQPIEIVAETGDIASGANMTFPKAADVIAGEDLSNLIYTGENLNPSDVTLIEAGGDIDYSTPTEGANLALATNSDSITVGGPGYLEVLAGGSINLGDSFGILTTGSLEDSRLSATGATLVVGAGLGTNAGGGLRQPDNQAFIDAYLAPDASTGAPSAYASTLIGYMAQLYPSTDTNLSYSAALSAFEALTPQQQLPLLSQVLSDILSATGLAHTIDGDSYTPGFDAIDTLFPTSDASGNPLTYSGDLNLVYSQLKTEAGGDIDLLVPGGSVVVGAPNPPASLSDAKQVLVNYGNPVPADVNLGLLVMEQGAIQGFAQDSFEVNQSRILTLEGGNIILWASTGSIDAGAGAKSASGAPAPVIETDSSGNVFVDPSNAISGSGIGQLLTVSGITPGLVNLIAPNGVVNAGDAGIRAAGNLNIAAVEVIGANNITVAGTATGVPVSEAGALAGSLSGANAIGGASNSAVQQMTEDLGGAENYQQMTQSLMPSFIVVKLFCLGAECQVE